MDFRRRFLPSSSFFLSLFSENFRTPFVEDCASILHTQNSQLYILRLIRANVCEAQLEFSKEKKWGERVLSAFVPVFLVIPFGVSLSRIFYLFGTCGICICFVIFMNAAFIPRLFRSSFTRYTYSKIKQLHFPSVYMCTQAKPMDYSFYSILQVYSLLEMSYITRWRSLFGIVNSINSWYFNDYMVWNTHSLDRLCYFCVYFLVLCCTLFTQFCRVKLAIVIHQCRTM